MTRTCLISPQQNGSSSTPGPSSTLKNSNKRSTLLCRTTTSVKKRWGCFFRFEPRTHQRSHNFHLGLFCLQEAEQEKQEAEKQQEDEEGWIKVTRGHKGAKARPHSEAANQRVLQREKKKKMRKELLNFYSWQHKKTQKERKLYFVWEHVGVQEDLNLRMFLFLQILLNWGRSLRRTNRELL